MYKKPLKDHGQYFGKNMALPKNTTSPCANTLGASGHAGTLAITMTAVTPVTIAATKGVSITVLHSDDNVTFTEAFTGTFTFPALKKCDVDDIVARMSMPYDVKKHVKVTIGTTDAAAAGNVDVFIEYLAI